MAIFHELTDGEGILVGITRSKTLILKWTDDQQNKMRLTGKIARIHSRDPMVRVRNVYPTANSN